MASVSKEYSDVLNPAPGEVLARVPVGAATADDVASTVFAANISWQL